jgi:hypothetical protein
MAADPTLLPSRAAHIGAFRAAWMALAGVLSLVQLAACGASPQSPPGPAPHAIAGADPAIVAVVPSPKGVLVRVWIGQPDLGGDTIRASGLVMRQVARAVQNRAADLPAGASVVTFELDGVAVDKQGRRAAGPLFQSDYDVNDLRNARLDQLGSAGVLNLAIDLRIDKGGIDPINAWCMRYPHAGANYCEMAGD